MLPIPFGSSHSIPPVQPDSDELKLVLNYDIYVPSLSSTEKPWIHFAKTFNKIKIDACPLRLNDAKLFQWIITNCTSVLFTNTTQHVAALNVIQVIKSI